ncbi:hypothetical protein, partial [Streptomyces sp. CBMA29]|uniref:hypothetical protein n=1 Tax=Streptomyces sp. CBMA29 TaxID=1896314 RepID=UPI00397FC986
MACGCRRYVVRWRDPRPVTRVGCFALPLPRDGIPLMSLNGLVDVVVEDAALAEAVEAAASGARPMVDLVGPPAARPL